MAELSKAQVTGIISLALILSGAVIVTSMKNSYYCQPEDNVKECIRVSDSKITCYLLSGSDRCVGGTWEPLENFVKPAAKSEDGPVNKGAWFTKSGDRCYEKGDLQKSYGC